jgi:hypothetical protein
MKHSDFQNLQSSVLTRFSNGKKPTQQDWTMLASIYTAALETHLAENIVNRAVNTAGLVTGNVVTNAMLTSLFSNIYTSSRHLETIIDMLEHNGFADGAVPTELEFAALINNFYASSNNKVRISINLSCLTNVQSGASAGIDLKAYEQTLKIADADTIGAHLSKQANVYTTQFIDVLNNIPILSSSYIGIKLFLCNFNTLPRYLYIIEQNTGTSLAKLPIQRVNSTYTYVESNDMMQLPLTNDNMLHINISAN